MITPALFPVRAARCNGWRHIQRRLVPGTMSPSPLRVGRLCGARRRRRGDGPLHPLGALDRRGIAALVGTAVGRPVEPIALAGIDTTIHPTASSTRAFGRVLEALDRG